MVDFNKIIPLIFILLLFFVPLVSAKIIYKGSVFPNEILDVDGFKFVLRDVQKEDVVILEYITQQKNISYILHVNKTEITDEFKLTYTGYLFDIDKGWGKLDPITFKEIPYFYVTIESLLPDLKLTNTISKKSADIYETVNVTINIKNKGDNPADKFVFEQHFPDYFEFLPLENLKKDNDKLYWDGILNTSLRLKYSFRCKKEEMVELYPNITYSYSDWVYRLATEPIKVDVKNGLIGNSLLNSSILSLGESSRYIVKLNNTLDKTQVSSLNIIFPKDMSVKFIGYNSSDFGTKKDGKLILNSDNLFQFSWQNNIRKDEELTFIFDILPKKKTTGKITSLFSSVVDGFYSTKQMNNSLTVNYIMPEIDVEFNTSRIEYMEPINIVVVLKDKGEKKEMRNLKIYLDGNFIESMELNKDFYILDQKEDPVLNIIYEPLIPLMPGIPFLYAWAIYETPFGEQMEISVNKTLNPTSVSNTLRFVKNTSYEDTIEPYIPPKKSIFQKIKESITTKIVAVIETYTNKKTQTIDDFFILPIIILILILAINMSRSWGLDLSKKGLKNYLFKFKNFIINKFQEIIHKFKIKK